MSRELLPEITARQGTRTRVVERPLRAAFHRLRAVYPLKAVYRLRAVLPQVLAAGTSGALLGLPYNHPDWYLLTWVAFVPLLWASRQASPWAAYGLGLCTGLVMYVLGAAWIVDFIGLYKGFDTAGSRIGAVLFWLYCAQLPACLMLLYRWLYRWLCLRTRVPGEWLFPPLVAIFYSYFPMLFPVQLAGSQSRFLVAIQATEWFGAASLDFMIAVANVLLWVCVRDLHAGSGRGRRVWRLLGVLSLVAWMGYGCHAVQRWDEVVADWPARKVGMVQPNEVPSERLPSPVPGYSRAYPPEMALTEQLAAAGAEVIVWPETRYKGYFEYPHVRQGFARQVAELGVPLVFQDIERLAEEHRPVQYNTAVLLGADGELAAYYRKIKRVPLGEYIPLLHAVAALELWLHERLPELFANFAAGQGAVAFAVDDFVMTPLICYEVMFPEFAAQAVAQSQGRVLVVLSNNGWFGGSQQPYQHLQASVLRSVENRLPMLHVTNNGPSGLVLPSGRLVVETAYQQKMGALLTVPFAPAPARTFFNRYPHLFLHTWLVVVGGGMLMALLPTRFSSAAENDRHLRL